MSEHHYENEPIKLNNGEAPQKDKNKSQATTPGSRRPSEDAVYDSVPLENGKPNGKLSPVQLDEEDDGTYRPVHRVMAASAYMSDGHRPIDFILSFKPEKTTSKKFKLRTKFREKFEAEMKNMGLELEYEPKENSPGGETAYVKIHATWLALSRQAEFEELQMPVQETDIDAKPPGWSKWLFQKILKRDPFDLPPDLQLDDPQFFTDSFERDKADTFLVQDPDMFFPTNQRLYLVWSIISGIQIKLKIRKDKLNKDDPENDEDEEDEPPDHPESGTKGKEKPKIIEKSANITYLLSEGVYASAYPLHDSDVDPLPLEAEDRLDYDNIPIKHWPMRKYLHESWAKVGRWKCYQPLDKIREYYGEKIAMYFAWLGFYTHMLVLPSIVGVLVVIVGTILAPFSDFQDWFCDKLNTNVTDVFFCRACRESYCPFQSASSQCTSAFVSRIFDYPGATFFSVFMAMWVIYFLEMWKRYQCELCARWDVSENEFSNEQVRPDFNLKVSSTRVNPVTHNIEPYLPVRSLRQRIAGSIATVVFFVSVVLSLLLGVMFYKSVNIGPRLWYGLLLDTNDSGVSSLAFSPTLATSLTASVMNGLCIAIMTKLYGKICWKMTQFEMPRTEELFEYSYTYKMFLFQFVNFYGALFYLSFVRGVVTTSPLNDSSGFFSVPNCPATGCLLDVSIQLAIIMTGKQILNNCLELGVPCLKQLMKRVRRKDREEDNSEFTRWEKDDELENPPPLNLFSDYLEMLIQYGFVTMFVPAFPLAPLTALINNIFEIRLDAFNMIKQSKRHIPVRAKDIGPWFELLNIVSKMAVFTNAVLIAFTSGFIDQMVFNSFDVQDKVFMDSVIVPFNTSLWCNSTLFAEDYDADDPLKCIRMQYEQDIEGAPGGTALVTEKALNYLFTDPTYAELYERMRKNDNISKIIYGIDTDGTNVSFNLDTIQQKFETAQQTQNFEELKRLTQDLAFLDAVGPLIGKLLGNIANTTFDPDLSANYTKIETCYIVDYRDPAKGYQKSDLWYHIIMSKLAFIIVFEHFILLVQAFLGYLIPDVPDHVTIRLQREEFLQREWFKMRELGDKYNQPGMIEDDNWGDADADVEDGQPVWDVESFATSLPSNTALARIIASSETPEKLSKTADHLRGASVANLSMATTMRPRKRPFMASLFKKFGIC